jgi:hypothetical protein
LKIYLISAGGSGAKVAESLIHLCGAGFGPDSLGILSVDADDHNGNRSLLESRPPAYQDCSKFNWSWGASLDSDSNIEMIKIIGHTDNMKVGGRSNADINLEAVFAVSKPVRILKFGSNCELGLVRAIAVKSMLENCLVSLARDQDCGLTDEGRGRIGMLPTEPILQPSFSRQILRNQEATKIDGSKSDSRDSVKPAAWKLSDFPPD